MALTSTILKPGIAQDQRVGRGVEDAAVLRLAPLQRAFVLQSLAHVAADPQRITTLAQVHWQVTHLDLEQAAVGAGNRRRRLADAVLESAADQPEQSSEVARVGALAPMPADDLMPRQAGHADERVVDVDDAQVLVPQHHPVDAAVENRTVLLFLRAQRRERALALAQPPIPLVGGSVGGPDGARRGTLSNTHLISSTECG